MNRALLSSDNMEWCTPDDFFKELDSEFHFQLDPAATDKSAKCARYYTPADDGLAQDWGGLCVFCNPPYGRHIGDWVRKGYEESRKPGTVVVMLMPARMETSYFHDYILHGKADEVRYIRGRLKFADEDGNVKWNAPFPSVIVVWRNPDNVITHETESIAASSDTRDTRRASYEAIKAKREARKRLILDTLGSRQLTASELTEELLAMGHIRYYDRNFVAPRLTELKKAGLVDTRGKRLCARTGKNVAIWARRRRHETNA